MHILTEIKNRGVNDVLMLVRDGLKGLPDAVETVWPKTIVQTCVVHLLRNSLPLCRPPGLGQDRQAPQTRLHRGDRGRGTRSVRRVRRHVGQEVSGNRPALGVHLGEFTPFLRFDTEIRRIVYTANAIESVNARIRRAVKARGHFPEEQAALKCVYMAIMSLDPTGKGQARWTMRWKTALNAFDITFDGRISAARQ